MPRPHPCLPMGPEEPLDDAQAIGWARAITAAATAADYFATRRRLDANLMEPGRDRDETRAMQRAGETLARRIRDMKMEEHP